MIKFILPFLIFTSLGVIIFILGKRLPQIREAQRGSHFSDERFEKHQSSVKKLLAAFLGKIRDGFVFLAEWFIKKTKRVLHLVHFWLLKIKKRKSSKEGKEIGEIEAGEELVRIEERDLEEVINGTTEKSRPKNIIREKMEEEESDVTLIEEDEFQIKEEKTEKKEMEYAKPEPEYKYEEEEQETEQIEPETREIDKKIDKFFFGRKDKTEISNEMVEEDLETQEDFTEEEREMESEEKKESFFGKFFGRFKKNKNKSGDEDEQIDYEQPEAENYSDGIVSIEEYKAPKAEENLLMKEVVSVKQPLAEKDLDEELGVDRKILEKKLVQKIASNPRNIENYRQLGELYIKMEEFIEAEECYKQILKLHVRDVDAKRKIEKIKLLKRIKTKKK